MGKQKAALHTHRGQNYYYYYSSGSSWHRELFFHQRGCCCFLPCVLPHCPCAVGDPTQLPLLVRKQEAAGMIMDTLCENLALWGLWWDYGRNLDEFWKRSNSALYLQLPFNFQSCKLTFPSVIFGEILASVPELWLTSSSISSLLLENWESFCLSKVCVVFLFERDLAVIYNTESLEQK